MKFICENPGKVASEMLYLAYEASSVVGMGKLQEVDNLTKEDILVLCTGQAFHDLILFKGRKFQLNADYLAGRMVKLFLTIEENYVVTPDREPRIDYQSWCNKYSTYESLFDAANEAKI